MRWSIAVLFMLLVVSVSATGCGNIYRSSDGSGGMMRVHRCSVSAASGALTHDAGREVHRGPPPLAGRLVSPHAPQVEEAPRRVTSCATCVARVNGAVEDWSPSPIETMVLPTSYRLMGNSTNTNPVVSD